MYTEDLYTSKENVIAKIHTYITIMTFFYFVDSSNHFVVLS